MSERLERSTAGRRLSIRRLGQRMLDRGGREASDAVRSSNWFEPLPPGRLAHFCP